MSTRHWYPGSDRSRPDSAGPLFADAIATAELLGGTDRDLAAAQQIAHDAAAYLRSLARQGGTGPDPLPHVAGAHARPADGSARRAARELDELTGQHPGRVTRSAMAGAHPGPAAQSAIVGARPEPRHPGPGRGGTSRFRSRMRRPALRATWVLPPLAGAAAAATAWILLTPAASPVAAADYPPAPVGATAPAAVCSRADRGVASALVWAIPGGPYFVSAMPAASGRSRWTVPGTGQVVTLSRSRAESLPACPVRG